MAFLTDVKLYNEKLRLNPDNVERVWADYDFECKAWFLDEKVLSKYKWASNDMIDLTPYLARPVVFMLVDQIEKLPLRPTREVPTLEEISEEVPELAEAPKPRKFREVVQRMPHYYAATALAFQKGGCVQFYDPSIDSDKIRDGDFLVYVGRNSKQIAETFLDLYDVEVLSGKELRTRMERGA